MNTDDQKNRMTAIRSWAQEYTSMEQLSRQQVGIDALWLCDRIDAAEQALATANKRIEKLREGLRDVQGYLRHEFKGLHLGRINVILEADDAASKENPNAKD